MSFQEQALLLINWFQIDLFVKFALNHHLIFVTTAIVGLGYGANF